MIVDFHTHLFPDKIAAKTIGMLAERSGMIPFADGTVDKLLQEMEEGDVNLSVVLPVVTKPEQFASITQFACGLNERFGKGEHRILSFGGVHPYSSSYKEELRELKQLGFRGIKLHPDYQGVFIDDMAYKRVIEEASKLDFIIVVHAGVDVGLPEPVHCPPEQMLSVIREVQPPKLVLAHLGGWKCWEQVEELLAGENVWMDTAVAFGICPDEQFKRIIEKHGFHRILFATDSPWTGQKESVDYLKNMGLSQEAEDAILYQNAIKLLGIS